MSRLDSLSGASFRPQPQTATGAAEKVAGKVLDGLGAAPGKYQKDSFDCGPRDPSMYRCVAVVPNPANRRPEDPGLYQCTARVPSEPSARPQDPGIYGCTARVPNLPKGLLPEAPKNIFPGWDPAPSWKPLPQLPKQDPARVPSEDPGIYGCTARVPSEDPGIYGCTARVPSEDPGIYGCTARVPSEDPGIYGCTARVPSDRVTRLLEELGLGK